MVLRVQGKAKRVQEKKKLGRRETPLKWEPKEGNPRVIPGHLGGSRTRARPIKGGRTEKKSAPSFIGRRESANSHVDGVGRAGRRWARKKRFRPKKKRRSPVTKKKKKKNGLCGGDSTVQLFSPKKGGGVT